MPKSCARPRKRASSPTSNVLVPVYAYKGLDARGKEIKGTRDAESPRALRTALKKDGIRIIEHKEESGNASGGRKKSLSGLASTEIDLKRLTERVTVADIAEAEGNGGGEGIMERTKNKFFRDKYFWGSG